MNKAGKDYIHSINSQKLKYKKLPVFSESMIQERVLRLGVENRIYKLESDEYEKMAIATLYDDFFKKESI